MVANKTSLYIIDPDHKRAALSKPKDAKDNGSHKAYYTRKHMVIHAAQIKKSDARTHHFTSSKAR